MDPIILCFICVIKNDGSCQILQFVESPVVNIDKVTVYASEIEVVWEYINGRTLKVCYKKWLWQNRSCRISLILEYTVIYYPQCDGCDPNIRK